MGPSGSHRSSHSPLARRTSRQASKSSAVYGRSVTRGPRSSIGAACSHPRDPRSRLVPPLASSAMGRLMVRHRDADDLARCPRAYVRSSARIRGTELPAPGLEMWRTVVDALQAAHRTEFSTCVLTLLTHAWRPRPRLRFTLLSLRAGRAVSCVWDQDDLGLAREVVRSWVGERLGLAEFPATSNSLCPSCGHLGACPAIARSTNGHLSLRKAITGREGPEASIDADPWTVFSPSRWRTYLQCPRRYRNRHVLGLAGAADGPSAESGLGLAVHRTLAEVHDVDPLGHRGLEGIGRRAAAEMEADPDEVATRAAGHAVVGP